MTCLAPNIKSSKVGASLSSETSSFKRKRGMFQKDCKAFQLEVRPEFGSGDLIEKVRVLPRKIQLHSSTDAPLNVTFIRAPSTALLKVDVPLVFIEEDISPGLRKGRSFFLSGAFQLEVRPEFGSRDLTEKVRVLPRKLGKHKEALDFATATQCVAPPSQAMAEKVENIKKNVGAAEAEKDNKANDGTPKPPESSRPGRVVSVSDILYRSEPHNEDAVIDMKRR
ncbi:hypothetical protein ACFE04_019965 [Oxalis oulophora]